MKKLLTTITLSALIGTSVSNLKPVFTSNILNHGFKSNQLNNKNISIQNENDTNPFDIQKLNLFKVNKTTSSTFSKDGTIWVGTYSGLWKSTDGIKFEQVTNGIPGDIAIKKINIAKNGTIWVGTEKGLWKSTDGIKFEQVTNGIPNNAFITSIAVLNDKIYIGIYHDLYKIKSDGNFEKINNFIGNGQIIALFLKNDGTIWVGTEKGLWKSTDGIKFEQVTNGITGDIAIKKINIAKNGTIYLGTYKKGLWKSTDGIKFEQVTNGISNNIVINDIEFLSDTNILIGTEKGLWKSTDGIKFEQVSNLININSLTIISNGTIWVGTENDGLWIINSINTLLKITKPDTFDKSWPLYNGIVYNSVQKIDIRDNLVATAILDTHSITVPTIDLDIPIGEHNLILTLKDKSLASVFGGDTSTGKVTYKLWVKTSIDKNKIDYQTKIDDTQLYTGLVSDLGNTNGCDIIQTKIKDGTGTHNASINVSLNDTLIDFDVNKSFYEQGTVDSSNNFTATGSKQIVSKNLSIQNDGIYHLHLEDTVGNTYDSYLELGHDPDPTKDNWKLKGTFDDSELDKIKTKLNVTVNITDPTQKQQALGWLHQYENFVENKFNETIKTNGKGFDSEIKNQIISYTAFLKPLTYDIANEPKFDDGLDKNLLVKTIIDKANEILKNGLSGLPKNLNVNTSNVVNKSTLEHYTNWINNYQDFINKNKDKWINDIEKIASRGFATTEQEQQIKDQVSQFLNNDNIKNYLKNVVWEDNKLLKTTSNDYQQYIEIEKLQSDTIDWVNTNMKEINIAYQQAIKNAESGLNLHGYTIDKILNGRQKPQTKSEIDNFADGQSYHDWLQTQANIKFRGWQLAMGFGIAIPLLFIVAAVAWVIRSRTNPKYNPIARGKKIKKENMKTKKEEIKNNNKEK